jgi:hypothetical protein
MRENACASPDLLGKTRAMQSPCHEEQRQVRQDSSRQVQSALVKCSALETQCHAFDERERPALVRIEVSYVLEALPQLR